MCGGYFPNYYLNFYMTENDYIVLKYSYASHFNNQDYLKKMGWNHGGMSGDLEEYML